MGSVTARILMKLLRARWKLGHTVELPVADMAEQDSKQAGVWMLLSWERLWIGAKKQDQMTSFMLLELVAYRTCPHGGQGLILQPKYVPLTGKLNP